MTESVRIGEIGKVFWIWHLTVVSCSYFLTMPAVFWVTFPCFAVFSNFQSMQNKTEIPIYFILFRPRSLEERKKNPPKVKCHCHKISKKFESLSIKALRSKVKFHMAEFQTLKILPKIFWGQNCCRKILPTKFYKNLQPAIRSFSFKKKLINYNTKNMKPFLIPIIGFNFENLFSHK